MAEISQFQIDVFFNKLFEMWPNKTGEASAKKAVTVYLKSGYERKNLLLACELYIMDVAGQDVKFTKTLANFINQDFWKDVLENISPERMKKKQDAAMNVISQWNKTVKSHWIKVASPEAYVSITRAALEDPSFAKHWEEALRKASLIFKYQMRDDDPRSKITLSLRWFCVIRPDKHTVLRIIEGELGRPVKDEVRIIPKSDPIDYSARQALAEEMKSLFPDIPFEKKALKDEPPKKASIQAEEITKKILDSMRIKPEESTDVPEFYDR